MGKTIAEALREEGWIKGLERGREEGREEGIHKGGLRGRRATLIRLLRGKFKSVPAVALRVIESTDDLERLDSWLDRLVTARTLAELKIN